MLPREVQLVLVKLKRSELVPQTSALVSLIIVLKTLPPASSVGRKVHF